MATYKLPSEQMQQENERIQMLESYGILDTLPEKEFDDLTALANFICGTKVSLIALMDRKRNWYKSTHGDMGHSGREMPREYSFCRVTIQDDQLFEIPDTLKDNRFKSNPVVVNEPKVRYYAGCPLINASGYRLGTLCVVDTVPKRMNEHQKTALRVLANQVMKNLEFLKHKKEAKSLTKSLKRANAKLDQLAHIIASDLKQPLDNSMALFQLSQMDAQRTTEYQPEIQVSLERMKSLIGGLSAFAESGHQDLEKEEIDVGQLVKGIAGKLFEANTVAFDIDKTLPAIKTEKNLLGQVFQNLISNAIKYNDKNFPSIHIYYQFIEGQITFSVQDNGPGIPEHSEEEIFEPFVRLSNTENITGLGIGLATTKKIVEERQGKIWVEPNPSGGAIFKFIWKD